MDNNNGAAPPYPPKYVMLNNNNNPGNLAPPPQWRNVPRYHSQNRHSKGGGNCCLKFICCCYCCLFLLLIIVTAGAFLLYYIYRPQIPSYKFENFEVKSFNINPDFSLSTEFIVTVKADNPNAHIGLKYGKRSAVTVIYANTTLCSGQLPSFHQPEKNVTMINVDMKGKTEFGSNMQQSLQHDTKDGKIPLLVKVKAPVTVVLGSYLESFPLREFVVNLNCSLVVDNLLTDKKPKVSSSKIDYDVSF